MLPLPQRPNTRDKCKESPNIDRNPNLITNENSFVLSTSEWKAAFSRTQKKMNDGWTKIMYNKLIGKVTLRTTFHSELQEKGKVQDVRNEKYKASGMEIRVFVRDGAKCNSPTAFYLTSIGMQYSREFCTSSNIYSSSVFTTFNIDHSSRLVLCEEHEMIND